MATQRPRHSAAFDEASEEGRALAREAVSRSSGRFATETFRVGGPSPGWCAALSASRSESSFKLPARVPGRGSSMVSGLRGTD